MDQMQYSSHMQRHCHLHHLQPQPQPHRTVKSQHLQLHCRQRRQLRQSQQPSQQRQCPVPHLQLLVGRRCMWMMH